ncbi:CDP-alcohol phosphatidyltransferase [Solicola sp. PLA-1-18]|uniref:CDP-alcohol phosphatidyltransferase n=1 Tax=Solicola sp. PLA-1-18 TaxID=3380532 RepID=UPI003B81D6FC
MTTTSGASPRRYRDALDRLLSAQKPSAGTAAYSRYVNRPLGRRVTAACHVVGMTPNQATAISATLSASAIALLCLVEPGVALTVSVPVLLALGYVMDSVDGQLSRLRGGGSLSGEWLDHTIDCIKTSTLHLAVLISWFRWPVSDHDAVLLVPVGFEVVAAVTFFGLILVPTLRPVRNSGSTLRDTAVRENPLRTYLLLPLDYGVVCWVFVLLAWPTVFAWAYSFLFVAAAAALVLALRKWWRELRALDAARAEA